MTYAYKSSLELITRTLDELSERYPMESNSAYHISLIMASQLLKNKMKVEGYKGLYTLDVRNEKIYKSNL